VVTPPKVPYTITFKPSKKNNLKEEVTKVVEDLQEWVSSVVIACRVRFVCRRRLSHAKGLSLRTNLSLKQGHGIKFWSPSWMRGLFPEWKTRCHGSDYAKKRNGSTNADDRRRKVVVHGADTVGRDGDGFSRSAQERDCRLWDLDTNEADPPLAEANFSKVDLMLNGEVVEPLAFVCHKDVAHSEAKAVCKKVNDGDVPRTNSSRRERRKHSFRSSFFFSLAASCTTFASSL